MADIQADGSRFLLGLRLEQKFRPTEGVGAISLSIFHYSSMFSIILQYIPLFFQYIPLFSCRDFISFSDTPVYK